MNLRRIAAWFRRPPAPEPAVILLYHRISTAGPDPFCLAVAPDRFAAQLDWLHRQCDVISLSEMTRRLRTGAPLQRAVALTFDDGYRDNFTAARPLLAARQTPATVYVASGFIGQEREFWWDELAYLLLTPPTLPAGAPPGLVLPRDDPAAARTSLVFAAAAQLRAAQPAIQSKLLDALASWTGQPRLVRDAFRAMSVSELRTLAADSQIEIGAHTLDHPSLATLPLERQRFEIVESRACLERWTGRAIKSFSYPYGSTDDVTGHTIATVQAEGFESACLNQDFPLLGRRSPFELPRMNVLNWSVEEFAARLSRRLGLSARHS